MRTILKIVVVLVAVGTAAAADAQTLQRPTRPYRGLFGGGPPPDPNRVRHELTLTSSVFGGYDDVITPGAGPVQPGVVSQSSYAGGIDALVNYLYGRPGRSISVDGRGYTNSYVDLDVDPLLGGDVRFRAETPLGGKSQFSVSQDMGYDPTLVLGAYGPLQGDVDPSALPETGQSSGYAAQRSWSYLTSLTVDRRWTTRQTSSAIYSYSHRNYVDELGFDGGGSFASFVHQWYLTRRLNLQASYRYSNSSFSGTQGLTQPLTDHTTDVGAVYTRRLSATRQVSFSGGAGATHVSTLNSATRLPLDYWTPSGYGTAQMDLGRSWYLSGDYRRAMTVLQGVTLESFATDAARIGTNGTIGRRFETSVAVAYANGRSAAATSQLARFASYSAMAGLRYALSRCCAASVSYDYYYYRLRDVSDLPSSIPAKYDRNAFSVGFTYWLPLHGSRTDRGNSR